MVKSSYSLDTKGNMNKLYFMVYRSTDFFFIYT